MNPNRKSYCEFLLKSTKHRICQESWHTWIALLKMLIFWNQYLARDNIRKRCVSFPAISYSAGENMNYI